MCAQHDRSSSLYAPALHYDLRMQVDGGTVSWAIPKGLLGLNKADESAHIAVETTIHPIDYTVYEGERLCDWVEEGRGLRTFADRDSGSDGRSMCPIMPFRSG